MIQVDKNKLIELCNEIKAKLIEKGKNHYVLNIATTNNYFDISNIDDDICEQLYDEYLENSIGCDTRLVSYDCGGYSRTLQLDGVIIEDDSLYFYLTEVEMTYDGDEDIVTLKEDLDGLLDERTWWMAGGNPEVEFRPNEVLDFYLDTLSDENCIFIV